MRVIPLEYRVLIRPDQVEKKTASGIIIPDSAAEKQQMAQEVGTVVAVGGNAFVDWRDQRLPMPGDRVSFSKYAGGVIEIDGVKHRICNDKDIMALLEETNA